ncbi:hypothetical protein [Chryseobacterium sp.]|uniref:hypothetical protein n=1 Tax=Chryseobacterium sp. TaxID=1871047 RepID=UPI0012BDACEC|nr:hypothetical protein [Chryseobacterium sp.]MPS65759.1 hypothetical protein [Chryseobacterium sp.]
MDHFKLSCFEFLEGTIYEEGAFNDVVMEMIDCGIEYLNDLNEDHQIKFNELAIKINDIKNRLGEEPINYGEEFLTFYKMYHNIEN